MAIVSMESSMDNINKDMPEISDGIVQGDRDYNESVKLVNDKSYQDSMSKAISAENNYNESLKKLSNIRDTYYKDLNDVHRRYIDTTINELNLKLQAVEELKLSIEHFEMHYNDTGSEHAFQANDYIYDSLSYQNQRDMIVQDNQKLFN